MNALEDIQIIPSGGALGAEVTGIDLNHPLPESAVHCVRQAIIDHCVLYFRDQDISEEDQIRFTDYFGKAVEHVRDQPDRENTEIFIVSNLEEEGKPIGALGNRELSFHSDLSYMSNPGTFTTLYAVEVPQTGGATQWCNCYSAYEALDDDTKARLKGLRAVHRHYIEEQNPPEPADHPIVCVHPESGRKSLYVGPHLTKYIIGIEKSESDTLLDKICKHLQEPRFVWTHDWQVKDLVMWDNRPTMHRRESFASTERRLMKRTQIFGEFSPVGEE